MHLEHKCRYASLLLMQGRSAWLDHFLHALACGAPLVFATDRSRPQAGGHPMPEPTPRAQPRAEAEAEAQP